MTNEDQIAALFANANPVPSLDVFDPVEPLDMDRLETRPERSRGMTVTNTNNLKVEGPGRWRRLAPVLAIPVIVLVAILMLANRENEVASPVSVATAFMGATAEHDGKAAWELFAPDTEERLLGLADWTSTYDLDRAIGWDVINQGCEERSSGSDGTLVDCPYLFENDWMRALGIEPTAGNSEFLVADGQIQSVTETGQADESGIFEAYRAFRAFVRENHPDDDSTMFGPGDQFLRNPESIALFEQYTDEFAASVGG